MAALDFGTRAIAETLRRDDASLALRGGLRAALRPAAQR
jgi:hypothetical protein